MGRVNRTRMGLTRKFNIPKTKATTNDVVKVSTVTPFKKFAITITKIAVTSILISIFILKVFIKL